MGRLKSACAVNAFEVVFPRECHAWFRSRARQGRKSETMVRNLVVLSPGFCWLR
jgi:hypothetical protein